MPYPVGNEALPCGVEQSEAEGQQGESHDLASHDDYSHSLSPRNGEKDSERSYVDLRQLPAGTEELSNDSHPPFALSNLKDEGTESNQSLQSYTGQNTSSPLQGQENEPLLVAPRQPQAPPDDVRAGMLWYLTASLFFVAMSISNKLLGGWGYPVFEVTLVRSFIMACFCLSALTSAGSTNKWGNRKGLLLLRGTLGYSGASLVIISCTMLPLADAITFTYLAPLVVALLSPILLSEKLSSAIWVVIPLCICGVTLITQPAFLFGSQQYQYSLLGVFVGLLQPVVSGTAQMTVRILRKTEETNVMVLAITLCTMVFSIIGCAFTWAHLVVPTNALQAAVLLMQGPVSYAYQFCITKGISKGKAASVMSMQYFSIVFSQLAGMLIFGEFTTFWGNVGMGVIVASMCGYMWVEARGKQ